MLNNFNNLNNLNSLLKTAFFLIIWAVIWLPIVLTVLRLKQWQKPAPNTNPNKLTLILSLYSITPILTYGVVKVESISLAELGITWQASFFQSILFGYCLSIATLFLGYYLQLSFGGLEFKQKPEPESNLIITFSSLVVVSFVIGLVEELVFRGIIVYFLADDYGIWLTAIISGVIFALLHLVWEQKNTIPQLPGLWFMGLILFYARLINDGSLGLAIGLHSGWVLILACVDTFDLFNYDSDIMGWLSGKKDQPLGSFIGLMILFLTLFCLFVANNWGKITIVV